MNLSIIYHSYTGITRRVAKEINRVCGGDLIEVKPRSDYSNISAYTLGCYRAMKGESDPIEPETIDVSAASLVVIGTPVWAFRATPAVNAAVAALRGCEGKKAVLFATCGGSAKDTLQLLGEALKARGLIVAGQFVLTRKDVSDPEKCRVLIEGIREAARL